MSTNLESLLGTASRLVDDTGLSYAIIAFAVPIAAAIAAVSGRDVALLNFVHVVSGAVWAGGAVFFTGVIAPSLSSLDQELRGTVTISLIPKAVLLFSGVAIATLVTGPGLAVELGLWNVSDPFLLIAMVIGLALLLLVIYVVRLQLMVFQEVELPGDPDQQRLVRISARLGRAGPVVLGLQLAALVVMALLRTGGI